MRKFFSKMVVKNSATICALVAFVAPVSARMCRTLFYEPEEPQGLEEFVHSRAKKKR